MIVKTESNNPQTATIKKSSFWMIYTSLLIAAIILLGDGFAISHLNKWTAKVGIALTFTVFFMLVCKNQTKAIIASVIIWVAVVATFVI
jgi:hypothetical protein